MFLHQFSAIVVIPVMLFLGKNQELSMVSPEFAERPRPRRYRGQPAEQVIVIAGYLSHVYLQRVCPPKRIKRVRNRVAVPRPIYRAKAGGGNIRFSKSSG
jgi:hypothetical protein